MDSQDQRGAVSKLVSTLRKITRVVQLIPFVYLLLLGIYLLAEPFLPDWALNVADNATYATIPATIGLLGMGKILRLCSWFKTACLLPMATKIEGYVDAFLITFTQEEVVLINTCLGIALILFLLSAYRHFFAR